VNVDFIIESILTQASWSDSNRYHSDQMDTVHELKYIYANFSKFRSRFLILKSSDRIESLLDVVRIADIVILASVYRDNVDHLISDVSDIVIIYYSTLQHTSFDH
jgi:hypothetical protein